RSDLTPASLTNDTPEVFNFDGQTWEPRNYDDYDGEITWRRALAMSRNLGTIHVGEAVGFDKVADVWKRVGVGTPPQGYPAITPGLLTVVWVGFDDNQPVSLSGSQAALPIWTQFMKGATAGRPSNAFDVPEGITFAEIDRDTGKLALPGCPRTFTESFLTGTEPTEYCELHRW